MTLDEMLKKAHEEKLAKNNAAMNKEASANQQGTLPLEQLWANNMINKQASAPATQPNPTEDQMTNQEAQALYKMASAYAHDNLRADALNKSAGAVTPEQQAYVQRMDFNKQAAAANPQGWGNYVNAVNNLQYQKQAYAQQYGVQALQQWEEQQKVAQEERAMGHLYGLAFLSGYNKAAEADPANTNPTPRADTMALGGNGAPSQVPDDSTKEQKAKELTIAANPYTLNPNGNKKQTAALATAANNMAGAGAGGTIGQLGGTPVSFVNPIRR